MALNPFVNPFADNPNAHYLFWNWLGPFLAWVLGAKSFWAFFAFHLACSVATTALVGWLILRNLKSDAQRVSLLLFALLPVSATSYYWVGADSLTLLLMVLALACASRPALTVAVGILLGMQHFEQGFFAVSALLLSGLLLRESANTDRRFGVAFCVRWACGILLGKGALYAVFAHWHIEVNSGRAHWLRSYFHLPLTQFFFHAQAILWSALGVGWCVALKYVDEEKRARAFFVPLAALCLLLPVSADQTRVFAVLSLPLLAAHWLFHADFLEKFSRRDATWLFCLWVLMPWSWVYGGEPKWSAFPYNLAAAMHAGFGVFAVPDDAANWPFH